MTSRSLWVIKSTPTPEAAKFLITCRSSSVSCGVRTAVGSSRMSKSTSLRSALRISMRCCVPTGRSSTNASGSTSRPYFSESANTSARAAFILMKMPRFGSLPRIMFSVTVITGTSWKCWCTMPTPRAIAPLVSPGVIISPLIRISPESGRTMPKTLFTRVDFPAPFSPSKATISPAATVIEIFSFATTPGKVLVTLAISRSALITPSPSRTAGLQQPVDVPYLLKSQGPRS
ncbi:unannotated protein [freshwater metagenome]|uniref:Unannotated protein n=1 Tax=freshwater metagenome TaxID=449393 RepID=A0A6J6V1S2_9ZZZZ